MTNAEKLTLKKHACHIRMGVIEGTHSAGCGHPGGSLSIADVLSYLYFKELNVDPAQPKMANRDRLVLSKGHAAPALYAALAERGFFPVEELKTLRKIGSRLQGHPNMNSVPGVDMSTGSLGQGISAACGMALGAKHAGSAVNVYAILGDGEVEEGECWEAFMFAAHYGLSNLCVMLDRNHLQIDGTTETVMNSAPLEDKLRAFNFNVVTINGHDFDQIESAVQAFHAETEKPTCIILDTVKGTGVSYMTNSVAWHGKGPNDEEYQVAMNELNAAGATKTATFQKAFPGRHFDCGIAEGNMIAVAAGASTMGLVPFASSFAMFAAGRAFEQVRNSIGYPHLNVKIGATHGGISVGEDGASHQCCEDFALMRSIPGMTVICPADDIEARAAVRAAYAMEGPVYLRFGRLAVPVFHDEANYHFELGKGEQLTEGNDIAIIATGLMVNEARMAAEQLAAEGIHARVINIHTIKPLDEEIVLKAAKECGKVITAEEHNVIGGLGEAVCAVLSEKQPTPVRRVGVQDVFGCSGPAWDLLKKFGLDAATICKTAHEMLGK